MRNRKWQHDKDTLAQYLYFDRNHSPIEASSPMVIALLGLFNKTSNLRAVDSVYKAKLMGAYCKLGEIIIKEFYVNLLNLNKLAARIRQAVFESGPYWYLK